MSDLKKCNNPICEMQIKDRRSPNNNIGRNVYCSDKCWASFTTSMRQACKIYKREETQNSLKELITFLNIELKINQQTVAKQLGVSQRTLKVWAIKLGLKLRSGHGQYRTKRKEQQEV